MQIFYIVPEQANPYAELYNCKLLPCTVEGYFGVNFAQA